MYIDPIVAISVWMTVADEPLEGFALLKKIEHIKQNIQPEYYDDAKFPMINYNKKLILSGCVV